jgi:N-acetylneuraminate synthase
VKLKKSVIAEIGINHDGDPEKAKRLILEASKSGCAGIKFQYRNVSRAYARNANEIGDEIILTQIKRTELSNSQIVSLRDYARSLGLLAGISFFTVEDVQDFAIPEIDFDFFKIPSAEMMNLPLIESLLATKKLVYISVGMHSELEIESIFNKISAMENWIPMHCISNYPVADHNSALGYITYMKNKWNRSVGYSSHDENWENNIIALTLGADVIERHITESRNDMGLDHSSSSTPEEFKKLCAYTDSINQMLLGNGPRVPNQGELLNKQNLGRSFYAKLDMATGTKISISNFEYRSPQIGLSIDEMRNLEGSALTRDIQQGAPLSSIHINSATTNVSDLALKTAQIANVALPVRLSDYSAISTLLPVGSFEFHLSYKEVASELHEFELNPNHRYSVHLPDYIDSTTLIDPFSLDQDIRAKSRECIKRIVDFSTRIAEATGQVVPVVASLAGINVDREFFYPSASALISEFSTEKVKLTLQWLPPFAWYFGGSIKLGVMNSAEDVEWIKKLNIPVTLDTSHLLLGKNAFGFDPREIISSIKENIIHWHISDSVGLDGEGMPIGSGGKENEELIKYVIQQPGLKVIEIWQGHFANFEGFKKEINKIHSMGVNS